MKRILCFGDSIVAGSQLPPAEKSQVWPALIEAKSKNEFQCVNAGRGGRPSDSFKEFVPEFTKAGQIDLLLIALGMNDSRDLKPDCPARAAAHLDQMLLYARDHNAKRILLVAPSNINLDALGPTKPIGPQRDAQLKRIGEAIRQLARRRDVAFADTYGVVSPQNLTRDGVHPNAAGNHEIADYLYPIIARLLS